MSEFFSPIFSNSSKTWVSPLCARPVYLVFIRLKDARILLEQKRSLLWEKHLLAQRDLWCISKVDGSTHKYPSRSVNPPPHLRVDVCEICCLTSTDLSPSGQQWVGTLLRPSNQLSSLEDIDSLFSMFTAPGGVERLLRFSES